MKICISFACCILWMMTCIYCKAQTNIKADQLYNLDENILIDKIILSESRSLDSTIFSTQIWLSDQVTTQFDPVFGIIINKQDILKKAESEKIKDLRNLFRLILSHEKMHARQYAYLQQLGKNFKALTAEDKRILECQADMCAGYLYLLPRIKEYSAIFTKSLLYTFRDDPANAQHGNVPLPSFNNGDSSMMMNALENNRDGLNLFFNLGDNEGLFGTHPNSVHRKEAFQLGVNAFAITAMSLPLPAEILNKIKPAEWEYLKSRYELARMMLAILPGDYNQFNSFFDSWSYRTACKIIHLNNKASSNMVFRVTKNKWDTTLANPLLYFEMDVTNNNPDSVLVDISVPVKLVSRRFPRDPLKSNVGTCWYKLFPLAPGATIHIKDSTTWPPANDSAMPRVFYPGEEGSMYAVQPIRPKSIQYYLAPAGTAGQNPGLAPLVNSQRLIALVAGVQRTFNSMPVNHFKEGAGLYWFDERQVKYNWYRGNHHFLLYIPRSTEEQPFLSTILAATASLPEAQEIYADFKSELLALDDSYSINENVSIADSLPYVEILNDKKQTVFTLSLDRATSGYEISLEFEKLQP